MSIRIENICKSFGDKEVLRGIDFHFRGGEVNMIIGGSGGGKTVLVKTIVGLLRPDKGRVLYETKTGTQDYWKLHAASRRALHLRIGMLFQGSALFDSMTVEENVAFPLHTLAHKTKGEIKERVNYCLERVQMAGSNPLYPSELSGGMKKRVGIARAIALEPEFLFCDEPNSGLDPQTAHVIDALIQDITQLHGMTTVVITHDIKSVAHIGDHVLFLYQGKKAWEGSRHQLTENTNVPLQAFLDTSGLFAG
ncbi:MAG: ABC transporter ATP-binding protein [Sphingobacteriia bacterium]|jgi:phospholipid/cholesterol/gamma-HCH transport system ATP-binding protein